MCIRLAQVPVSSTRNLARLNLIQKIMSSL
jgi:hypothetical protein